MRKYLALALLATACKVEGGDIAPLKAGDGITVGDKNTISVDPAKVPLVTECASGFLRREGDAWKCVALEQKDVKDLEATLVGKLGKDEAGGIYLTKDDANAKFLTPEAADAKYETKEAAQAFALATDLSALEATVYLKTEADGLFATKASLGDYYTKTESDARFAAKNHQHAIGDLSGVASQSALDALSTKVDGLTKSSFLPNVPSGSCITVQHGWNTRAVGYSAWYSDPAAPAGTMVPAQPGYDPGTVSFAQSGTASATSDSGAPQYSPAAIDGNPNSFWAPDTSQPLATWTLDLGSVRTLSRLGVLVSNGSYCSSATSYDITLSQDGTSFTPPVATGTCSYPGSCSNKAFFSLPSGTSARYVRFLPKAVTGTCITQIATLAELEVYASTYTVSMPDENTVKFCNYTGIARDLSLAVWH